LNAWKCNITISVVLRPLSSGPGEAALELISSDGSAVSVLQALRQFEKGECTGEFTRLTLPDHQMSAPELHVRERALGDVPLSDRDDCAERRRAVGEKISPSTVRTRYRIVFRIGA
jgi:hypothetical protein